MSIYHENNVRAWAFNNFMSEPDDSEEIMKSADDLVQSLSGHGRYGGGSGKGLCIEKTGKDIKDTLSTRTIPKLQMGKSLLLSKINTIKGAIPVTPEHEVWLDPCFMSDEERAEMPKEYESVGRVVDRMKEIGMTVNGGSLAISSDGSKSDGRTGVPVTPDDKIDPDSADGSGKGLGGSNNSIKYEYTHIRDLVLKHDEYVRKYVREANAERVLGTVVRNLSDSKMYSIPIPQATLLGF